MILSTIDHTTGLPLVQETRGLTNVRGCTCPFLRCQWKELPRAPFGDRLHALQSTPHSTWTPKYQTWVDGIPTSVLCWKCGRPIKGWAPKLTPFGEHFTVNGQPAVHLALYDFYRAKRFEVYLPSLDEIVSIDALHCADCQLDHADGETVMAIWLAGLLEAHKEGLSLAQRVKLPVAHSKDDVATFLSRFSQAEPIGAQHRAPDDQTTPRWRS